MSFNTLNKSKKKILKINQKNINIFDNLYVKNKNKFYWLKFFGTIVFANLIFIIIYSKIILANKIYIPSFYFISQSLYNLIEKNVWTDPNKFFNLSLIGFYTSSLILNIPLIIFSYYKIGKQYTLKTIISILIWFIIGIVFSIQVIDTWLKEEFLKGTLLSEESVGKPYKKVTYYLIAIISGVCVGMASSLIWKLQISGGGLDIIYTYFAKIKKAEIYKFSIWINLVIVLFSIFLNESLIIGKIENFGVFIFLLIGALTFGFSYSWTLNYFYPKFKLVNLFIVTTKEKEIKNKIIEKYKRGGSIINAIGLYDNKNKKIIFITMTYLEKERLIYEIKKIDRDAFFIVHKVSNIGGNFKIKVNDDD